MNESAVLIEELSESTGLARNTVRDFVESVREAFGDRTDALRQRISAIMAQSRGNEEKYDAVVDVTEDSLDRRVKGRLFAALGLGVLGGFVLAGATTALAMIAGIVLIVMAGFMIRDVVRLAMDRVSEGMRAFRLNDMGAAGTEIGAGGASGDQTSKSNFHRGMSCR